MLQFEQGDNGCSVNRGIRKEAEQMCGDDTKEQD